MRQRLLLAVAGVAGVLLRREVRLIVVELAALGLVSAGIGLVYFPAALIVAGLAVIVAVEVRP